MDGRLWAGSTQVAMDAVISPASAHKETEAFVELPSNNVDERKSRQDVTCLILVSAYGTGGRGPIRSDRRSDRYRLGSPQRACLSPISHAASTSRKLYYIQPGPKSDWAKARHHIQWQQSGRDRDPPRPHHQPNCAPNPSLLLYFIADDVIVGYSRLRQEDAGARPQG